MDRLKSDKLRLDDPSCSQYQIVLDLMGKDEVQTAKDRIERAEKAKYDYLIKEYNERK